MTDRAAAEARGRRAESLAAWALRLKGWRILARRARTPLGELDLVARRGGLVIFVEVKARATGDDALAAIDPSKQARLVRAARAFLARRPDLATCRLRFDAIAVESGAWPRHIAGAFMEE